jgi:hypothetical protein
MHKFRVLDIDFYLIKLNSNDFHYKPHYNHFTENFLTSKLLKFNR